MKAKDKPFQSPADMLQWQWRSMIEELNELQRHLSDPTCPCTLADSGEFCGPKHALGLHTLAKETIAMSPEHTEMLEDLAEEALDQHNALKDRIVCGKPHKDEKDTVVWSRQWRKRLEPIYYSCDVKLKEDAKLFENYPLPKTPYLTINAPSFGVIPEEYQKFKVDLELKRHPDFHSGDSPAINSPALVQSLFSKLRYADREWLLVICLDTRLHLVGLFEQAIGTPDSA
ncbi:MAG: hypothetical protein Q8O98_02195, partial [bacterium]|nr:hypothetical protein [bacterium]